jgi:hypothetical protein
MNNYQDEPDRILAIVLTILGTNHVWYIPASPPDAVFTRQMDELSSASK